MTPRSWSGIEPLSRRELLAVLATQSLLASLPGVARAQNGLQPLNRFPRMVQEHFVRRVRTRLAESRRLVAALRTRADAEAYVHKVRQNILKSFGPLPAKTPLQPRITGVVERDTYRIEKVIFESRPDFLVTANLYIPRGKLPAPGVVGTCGHSVNGKAAEAYQSFAQGLVRQGYVVLIYDPLGQGERLQYVHKESKVKIGPSVEEHLYAGNQQYLVGEFLGNWMVWDGIRALDYLLTRKEVDPSQVGVTGNSGGGTQTTWLCGMEQRWTMAAPSCFVTSFQRNLENELPADTEQCPPKAIALGLDHADFLAALAPKPVIILAKERDYFDVRGSQEALARLKHIYRLLGAEDQVSLFVGPTPHGYTQENREAMYRWFNQVTRISDAREEPSLSMEKDETLQCTPRGQVWELGSRAVFSFTQEKARQLRQARAARQEEDLVARVRQVLRLPEVKGVPEYRILRSVGGRRYPLTHFTTYAVETEPNVFAIVYRLSRQAHQSRPPQGIRRALLYVSHHSSDVELREEPFVGELIGQEKDAAHYTCDVRGIGDSMPDTCGPNSFLRPYGCDYFYAAHALMLDAPYLGQKTLDVLRVLAWLRAQGHEEIHLAARGWGALPAVLAAVVDGKVQQVTLKNALTSYQDVAESEAYGWPLSSLLPGVLEQFDLPDCYTALKGRLRLLEPVGAEGVRS